MSREGLVEEIKNALGSVSESKAFFFFLIPFSQDRGKRRMTAIEMRNGNTKVANVPLV